jgi:NADP-dependent 3-hydroxy acid dehydrogenase YdfG
VVGGRQADTLAALAAELRGKHALCDITKKADVEALAKLPPTRTAVSTLRSTARAGVSWPSCSRRPRSRSTS